jgi:hypothetical protein
VKYHDLVLDTGTEEIAHLEMLAIIIARVRETSTIEQQEDMAKNSIVGAVLGGARGGRARVGDEPAALHRVRSRPAFRGQHGESLERRLHDSPRQPR